MNSSVACALNKFYTPYTASDSKLSQLLLSLVSNLIECRDTDTNQTDNIKNLQQQGC